MHTASVLVGETAQKMNLITSATRSVKIFLFSKNEGERKQAPLRQMLTLRLRSVLDQFPAIQMISKIHFFKVSIQIFFFNLLACVLAFSGIL